MVHLPISEFLQCVHFTSMTVSEPVYLPINVEVIPVIVVGDEIILDTREIRTTKESSYNPSRIHKVTTNFCYDILGLSKWIQFYFIDHHNNNMIGFLIRGDEVSVKFSHDTNSTWSSRDDFFETCSVEI